jgi:hypothetical protein
VYRGSHTGADSAAQTVVPPSRRWRRCRARDSLDASSKRELRAALNWLLREHRAAADTVRNASSWRASAAMTAIVTHAPGTRLVGVVIMIPTIVATASA